MFKIKAIYLLITINIVLAWPFFAQAQEVRNIIFPIQEGYDYNFGDTYGAARSGGRTHLGTDIMVAKMTPVLAAVDGRVSDLVDHDEGWGLAIYIEDAAGYSYRYLHINNDTPGTDDNKAIRAYAFPSDIQKGSTVTAGQVIAWAGDSGNAENVGAHLHFEIWTPGKQSIDSYASLMAAIGKPVPVVEKIAPAVAGYQFTRDLKFGSQGEDVRQLQMYLNKKGFLVAASGVGSPGQETANFGLATQAALVKFQKARGVSPAVGYFGPMTRAIVNGDSGNNSIVQASWLVKDKTSPRVYYVSADLELHWIVSQEAAIENYGADWFTKIRVFDDLNSLGLHFGTDIQ